MLARVLPKVVEVVAEEEEVVVEVVEDQEQEVEVGVGMEEGAAVVAVQPPLEALVQQLLLHLEGRQGEQGRQQRQQGLGGGSSGHRQSGGEAVSFFPPPVKLLLFLRS